MVTHEGEQSAIEQTDETGLNFFDDRASAAGSFGHAMLGYDRTQVDAYVRDLEHEISTLRQLVRRQRSDLALMTNQQGDTDFTRLGSYATSMLRAAETQAADLVSRAGIEAERIKEEGRRVATELRAGAQQEADDIRVTTLNNLRQMRQQAETEIQGMRAAARRDAENELNAARAQGQALLDEVKQNNLLAAEQAASQLRQTNEQAHAQAAGIRHNARNEADQLLGAARNEADLVRQGAHTQAEQTLGRAN